MKLKIFPILTILVVLLAVQIVKADASLDNGINFLKSKQDSSGKITSGFSAPSQWSTITLTVLGIDVTDFKTATGSASLKDFLLSDIPANGAVTDWESRILAIVAIDEDPASFGGVNYLQNLEGFYNNDQLGDICALNDDIFGLLALIASGSLAKVNIKQHILDFIISKQDLSNGGFGFSAPGCAWYETASDMTAAAIQALQAAKDNGLTNNTLDDAISRAKTYLLTAQNADGGFGYYGSSDTDTTGWAVMALNVLGMKDTTEGVNAKNYLLSKQSSFDGGFQAFDWGSSSDISNSTTTAQSLIALSGKSWILKIFTPSATPSATPSSAPTPTPSPTPIPTPSATLSPSLTPTPTPSPIPTASSLPTSTPIPITDHVSIESNETAQSSPTPAPIPDVLGASTEQTSQQSTFSNPRKIFFSILSLANFLGAALYWKLKM